MTQIHNHSTRKGVSSVIGGFFFLVIMTAAFSVWFLAIDTQTAMIETQIVISEREIAKTQEAFALSAMTDPTNNERLSVSVINVGNEPIDIVSVWIVNKSNSSPQRFPIDSSDSIIPPGFNSNILENKPIYLSPQEYEIKVISSYGLKKRVNLSVPNSNHLKADLMAIPPHPEKGHAVSLVMPVANDGPTRLLNVTANNFTIIPSNGILPPLPSTPASVDLDPGDLVFFKWQYTVTGNEGTAIKFSGNASATDSLTNLSVISNNVTEIITLNADNGTDNTIILNDDLLVRPEMFAVFPSPFGESKDKTFFGVNVVNPTSRPFDVSKVAISLWSARANANDRMFDISGAGDCAPTGIPPTPNRWDCNTENQLVWVDYQNPIRIENFSNYEFKAYVNPGTLANTKLLDTVPLQIHVFTSIGEFGKTGYGTSFNARSSDASSVGLFLSSQIDSNNIAYIEISRDKIPSNSLQIFNVTLSDFEKKTENKISAGSEVIVNVPRDWELDTSSLEGFTNFDVSYAKYSDGTSQVRGKLLNEIDGSADNKAKSFQFEARAPQVSATQLYIMYMLGDGVVTNGVASEDFALGPLAEIVLQVIP